MDSQKIEEARYNKEGQTFVFDGHIVKLTGRKAEKIIRKEGKDEQRKDFIYEIVSENGTDWTGWVRLRELYIIKNINEE